MIVQPLVVTWLHLVTKSNTCAAT